MKETKFTVTIALDDWNKTCDTILKMSRCDEDLKSHGLTVGDLFKQELDEFVKLNTDILGQLINTAMENIVPQKEELETVSREIILEKALEEFDRLFDDNGKIEPENHYRVLRVKDILDIDYDEMVYQSDFYKADSEQLFKLWTDFLMFNEDYLVELVEEGMENE